MVIGAEAIGAAQSAADAANPAGAAPSGTSVSAAELEQRMLSMQGIIDRCVKDILEKFQAHESKIETLTNGVQNALSGLQNGLNLVKAQTTTTGLGGGGGGHGDLRKGGIIDRKSMLPTAFSGGKGGFRGVVGGCEGLP